MGVAAWGKIKNRKRQPRLRQQRKVWVFGDSLLHGVGKELFQMEKETLAIKDRTERGANINRIQNILIKTLKEENVDAGDYIVIEGGGNSLEKTGVEETILTIENMVRMAKNKAKNVIVINIPMRKGYERGYFGNCRRMVNRKCLENLEKWGCDGLQLYEQMDWSRIWGRDGIHFSWIGREWIAANILEWIVQKDEKTRDREMERKTR